MNCKILGWPGLFVQEFSHHCQSFMRLGSDIIFSQKIFCYLSWLKTSQSAVFRPLGMNEICSLTEIKQFLKDCGANHQPATLNSPSYLSWSVGFPSVMRWLLSLCSHSGHQSSSWCDVSSDFHSSQPQHHHLQGISLGLCVQLWHCKLWKVT